MTHAAEDVRLGGWIVAVYKAISTFGTDDPAFDEYETIITAARSAELLSSIRSLGKIDGTKFEVYRRFASLKPKQGLAVVIALEDLGAVQVDWDSKTTPKTVKFIEAKVTSKAAVFATSANLFRNEQPTEKAKAVLSALEISVHLPIRESDLISELTSRGFADGIARKALDELVWIELLARTIETERGETLIHNPYAFRKDVVQAHKILSGLSSKDRETAMQLLDHVRKQPGVPFPAKSDRRIVNLLTKLGLIDISGVRLKSGTSAKEFPTAPDIWGVFAAGRDGTTGKDLIDDSKLLLNSLRYGEIYSPPGRGRINSPIVLVEALITRGQVGPATAIGEDYPLPLARGIVSITESRLRPGRYFMELRKKDIAESVRDVIEQNVILPAGDVPAPEIMQTGGGAFISPDRTRIKRELPKDLIQARDSMIFDLRTYRNRQ